MFQKGIIDQVFYPGSQWVYFRIYLGPAAADQWICEVLPGVYQSLVDLDPGLEMFFVRFMDPDFHIRLRINSRHPDMFLYSLKLLKESSDRWIHSGYLWKIEIGTYDREINRYGLDKIENFEQAFCADSAFWIRVLAEIFDTESFESLRWKAGLVSMMRYFQDLIVSESDTLNLIDSVLQSLEAEINPPKSFSYRLDQKYRQLSDEFRLISQEKHPVNALIVKELDRRSERITAAFTKGIPDTGVADLVHMNLNRCLRSKHRVQEFVLYYYLKKIVRLRQALM